MPFPTSVDAIVDAPPVTAATRITSSQVLGPQRVTVGPAWVNVKSDQYGALGDGSTDDTAAIQAAENAAATQAIGGASGGLVYFPPGTYMASGIVKKTNVHWLGAGFGTTIIKLKNSAPTATPLVIGDNFATLTGTSPIAPPWGITGFSVRNLTFDGNKVNNVSHAVPLIQWYGFGYLIDSVAIVVPAQDAFYSEWTTASSVTAPFGLEARFSNLFIMATGRDGIQFNGPHDSLFDKIMIENAGRYGVWAQTKGNSCLFNESHIWGGTAQWSWFLDQPTYLNLCEGEDASAGAVWCRNNGTQIRGGTYFGTPVGIRIGITAGIAPAQVYMDGALVYNCSSAAIDLQNDGGNNTLRYYTSGGNAAEVTGASAAGTDITAWSAQKLGGSMISNIVDTFAASYTPNALYENHDVTLTGNITVNAPTFARKGMRMMFVFTQDATGGRTVTFAANYKNSTGAAIVTTANTRTIDLYYCRDEINWILLNRQTGQVI